MKPEFLAAALMLLSSSMPVAATQATTGDEALCRGSYPVLLMTANECSAYTRQVMALRSTGQFGALATLQQQHALQLEARAATCPCMESKSQATAPQHLVMLEPDC